MKRRLIKFTAVSIFLAVVLDLADATSCIYEKTGEQGECKTIRDCDVVLRAYQQNNEQPELCEKRFRTVCCPIGTNQRQTDTTRISVKKCKQYAQYAFESVTVQSTVPNEGEQTKKVTKCNHDVVSLIVGGEEAKEREFPHMALIGYGEGRDEDFHCGGSLISEQWIVSAAHCKFANRQLANYAKVGNIVRNSYTPNVWTYKIIDRIGHPDYNSRISSNDIILFKLEQPVTMSTYVIPICLPIEDHLTTRSAIATGWGRTGYAEDVSEKLMKVIIDYFKPEKCEKFFEGTGRQIYRDKMVCAGSINKIGDTCQGDSGGPLQVFNNDPKIQCMYTIIGITSYGLNYCGSPGLPAVYTKVFHYLDWIEKNVWPGE